MHRGWMRLGIGTLGVVAVAAAGAAWSRARHERGLEPAWAELAAAPDRPEVFHPGMVEGLPAPARRYLLHAIAAGTPVAGSVELRMSGGMQLRPGTEPMPMEAHQVLSPRGYIWKARVGRGAMRIRGYDRFVDGAGEMRWWLQGLVPVVRASGHDLDRSAAGRLAAEAVFLPSLFLPGNGAEWEAVDDSTARVRLPRTGETQPLRVVVDSAGRLRRVSLLRWNGDPANGTLGYTPFAAEFADAERTFGGYTIPTRMRGGWRLGEPDEFAFFRPVIEEAVYR